MRKLTQYFILIMLLCLVFPSELFPGPLFGGRTEKQIVNRLGVYPVVHYTANSVTDGIQEAIDAANDDSGGVVWLTFIISEVYFGDAKSKTG